MALCVACISLLAIHPAVSSAIATWVIAIAAIFAGITPVLFYQATQRHSHAAAMTEMLNQWGAGEVARARNIVFSRAVDPYVPGGLEGEPEGKKLEEDQIQAVFTILWALQRMSVLTPALAHVGRQGKNS